MDLNKLKEILLIEIGAYESWDDWDNGWKAAMTYILELIEKENN